MRMDTKQKTLLVMTIAAFGYLGFQVYGLVRQDVSTRTNAIQTNPVYRTQAENDSPTLVQTANAGPREVGAPAVIPQSQNLTQLQHAPLVRGQKAYLDMVNQYELAKMKRRLLEERASIAEAQHRIATLNQKTREIDEGLMGQTSGTETVLTNARSNAPYNLSYLDNQHGQWTATLAKSGNYHEVGVGTELPNGAKVVNINRQGVTLENGAHRELVTFNGIVAVKVPTVLPKARVSAAAVNANILKISTPMKFATIEKPVAIANVLKVAAPMKVAIIAKPSAEALKAAVPIVQSKPVKVLKIAMRTVPTAMVVSKPVAVDVKQVNYQADIVKLAARTALIKTKPSDIERADTLKLATDIVKKVALNSNPENTAKAVAILKTTILKKDQPEATPTDMPLAVARGIVSKQMDVLSKGVNLKKKVSLNLREPTKLSRSDQALMQTADEPSHLGNFSAVSDANLNGKLVYSADEQRILKMSSRDYTIQLIGSYHRDVVDGFIVAHNLDGKTLKFHVNNRGKKWHMVLYGDYKNLAQARQALYALPAKLTPEHPWLRRIAGVQRAIKKRS